MQKKIKAIIFGAMVLSYQTAFSQKAELEMQKAINQVGEPCHKVTQVFMNGKDKEGSLHLSVACSGGENYGVLAKKNGDALVLRCAVVDKLAGGRGKPGSCFNKFQ
jgi:hypothetical protein